MIKLMFALLLSIAACPANAVQSNPVAGATYTSDFTTGALDSRYTFTRASSAWYYNSSGILTQAYSNVPRFDYNPSTLAINGLLVEGQATNLLSQSNGFTTTPWYNAANAVLISGQVSPDGSINAWQYTMSGAAGYITQSAAVNPGTTYTASVYIKPISGTGNIDLVIGKTNSSDGAILIININGATLTYWSSGALGTGTFSGYAIQAITNGWYRCSVSGSSVGTAGGFVISPANNGEVLNIYGAQLEANNFASSPIPTTTTVATRLADSVVNSSIGGWFNNSQGTFTTEFITAPSVQAYQVASSFSDGTFSNRLDILAGWGSGTSAIYWQNSLYTNSSSTPVAITANVVHKIGYSYNGSVLQGAQDGVLTSTIPGSPLVIPTLNQLNIGSDTSGIQLFGWIRKFRYWRTMLSNTNLKVVTQ